ncbi:rhodanese-like domain-containing protein [Thermobispora bispora]|jgi:rhodanese-related sulfurtransferase|nr:rhodanese-like domain-containing protein [Thermobispora bispora]MBO2475552.1 rhodanese-like domain-containing protein [Actinomycetales bacterium]MBX6167282.1 rhodanese-like domain-containing protein [Thermobispora bispora]QSI46745.1 rhodanese-like domain-containing protein [Thermobispora bispora]
MARMTVHEVDASEVPENAFLLDVRELDEWRAGHAPQAVHIPMGDLRSRIGEVPDAQPIYVICRAGGRSAQAAAWLNHIGKQAINVGGGMQSWAAAGRPMVSETGMPPYVA